MMPYEIKKRKIQAVGNWIYVERAVETFKTSLVLPQTMDNNSYYGLIKSVGSEVTDTTLRKDMICSFNKTAMFIARIAGIEYHFFRESDVNCIKFAGLFRPLGFRVLVKRDIEEKTTAGGIIIPGAYKSRDQSLDATVFNLGVKNNKLIDPGINPGDFIRLAAWRKEYIEISNEYGYMLNVPVADIVYKMSNV